MANNATTDFDFDHWALLAKQDPEAFERLREQAVDLTSSLYNTTMYLMAALLLVELLCNAGMRPVASKHYLPAGSAATDSTTSRLLRWPAAIHQCRR